MERNLLPDYIFETSWEVCNKVGGIYTVLSTRAQTLISRLKDNLIFIGPDCWGENNSPFFREDVSLFFDWTKTLEKENIKLKVGRWLIPGEPIAILVDYQSYFKDRNTIYAKLWEDYKVDSLHAYGDYDESAMFSYATARVVESFYHFYLNDSQKVVFHANEWQTGFAALMLQKLVPHIATLFTTHATGIGRSIAGNNKPLYSYLQAYNGDQMADELNMQSKHSIEKQTAFNVDCFTTVSEITATECKELLDKPVDFILPNGFENNFVPKSSVFTRKRNAARKKMLNIANCLTGVKFSKDAVIISTSGRYEFRNKGIDVFIEAINRLRCDERIKGRQVIAFIEVPGWVSGPREDLVERLNSGKTYDTPLDNSEITHWLYNMEQDAVMCFMRYLNIHNDSDSSVKLIFIPSYLIGDDGIVDLTYYDFVLGNDLSIYASYYEPWGYTPLESIAFKVPTITTDLAGFGLWANSVKGGFSELNDGVKVIHRTDDNYSEVADSIKETIITFLDFDDKERKNARDKAEELSKKALWGEFIKYYDAAYDFALRKSIERNNG